MVCLSRLLAQVIRYIKLKGFSPCGWMCVPLSVSLPWLRGGTFWWIIHLSFPHYWESLSPVFLWQFNLADLCTDPHIVRKMIWWGKRKSKMGIKTSCGEQSFLRKLRHPCQNIFKMFFLLLQFDLFWNNRFSSLIYFFFNLSLIVVECKLNMPLFFLLQRILLCICHWEKKCLQYLLPYMNAKLNCVFPPRWSLEMCCELSIILNSSWTLVPSSLETAPCYSLVEMFLCPWWQVKERLIKYL